jgi:EAL domain-containing protein (putative c-di-GMP-specific phosphodiesterase class I)
MLLPQLKEREYRFKLALRIGLPIFALILAFISHTLITNYHNLQSSFYVEALILVTVSIYFIFYLIYNGFSVKITDDITKTFTREYIYNYLKKEIANEETYTLVLISIDNIIDINKLYGIKNGDRVLQTVVKWIADYFESENIKNFPMGHIKGGEFLIGLPKNKEHYTTTLELLCLKASEFKVGDIEVKISGAIIDTNYAKDLDYLVERLFELLEKNKNSKNYESSDEINPSDLESAVIMAIKKNRIEISYQNIYDEKQKVVFKESFIRLYSNNDKRIYPKLYLKIISKLGLGVAFDTVVFENIIAQSEEGDNIAINIFPTSLRNEKFLSKVKESLQHKKITIIFILSEMEYYSHIKRYNSILQLLKEYNVKIAVDRVGSLHTSFLYLRELDIDMIRFDTYYSSIERLKKNRDILLGFTTMAHEKGIKSWIKNIENEESYTLAKDIGIDFFQGKYLSKVGE